MAAVSNRPQLLAGAGVASPSGISAAARTPGVEARSLLDLLYDGFYMLFLLRNRGVPEDAEALRLKIRRFLSDFERGAQKLNFSLGDVHAAAYAFCALVDETVLRHVPSVRDAWQRRPLQLDVFGEQLAGEQFFVRLDHARTGGAAKVAVIEVFYMCLLAGFRGKYLIDGAEKLAYLTARLGDEIAHLKGERPAFAPHWAPPDRVAHALKNDLPMWVVASIFCVLALTAYIGLRAWLGSEANGALARYHDVVQQPPATAHITITLP
jgi:type VI secretion system protein ImpK